MCKIDNVPINYYQLGDGTTERKSTPVQVKGAEGKGYLKDVVAVSAGMYHSVALKTDGSVWSWGRGDSYALGYGSNSNKSTPVQVRCGGGGYLTDIVAVAPGVNHSVALKADGSVWAWGGNYYGQIGDGRSGIGSNASNSADRSVAVQVRRGGGEYLTDIVDIAVGQYHSIALKTDGSVWSWGYNRYGQTGVGTYDTDPKGQHFIEKYRVKLQAFFSGSIFLL